MAVDQSPMNKLITEHIDIWTSAVKSKSTSGRGSSKKLELYGVKKLRELILELAVRGKLVPQDPSDEPASVLLERIARDKAQLIKDKKIKKNRKQPEITQDEIYFSVPENWSYARLEDIYDVRDGTHDSPKPTSKGYPLVTSKNLSSGKLDLSTATLISKEDHLKVIERSRVDRGDILFAMIGSIGNPVIVDTDIEFSIKNVGLFKYYNPKDSSPNFLNYFLKYAAEIMKKQSTGGVQPFVSLGKLRGFVMPIPPISEQHRIVTKVDELMALCDQLELQTEASIEAHQVLVTTLLDTLTNSADADELMQNWARISEHFDTLFTTEESINQLKQTILQLAVMGKLVPQDPSDEPAAELLKRIAEEKAQLVKEKKIKKHPAVEPIGELGDIPQSWERIVVQDFADIKLGSTPSRHESKYWNGDIPWVSSGEVANNIIYDTNEKITHDGFMNSSTSIIPKRSLLMAIIGQGKTRGQTALLEVDACTNQNVAAFIFNENFVIPEYVWLWAKSKYDAHRQGGHGGAQPALNAKKVRSFAFPLPPTSEQKKIVERVEEIHSVCDHLAARLKEGQNTQIQLTDAIVGQVM